MQQENGKKDQSLWNRPISRREFSVMLGVAAAAGGGLITRAMAKRPLTPAQNTELRRFAVAQMGKQPKRALGNRMKMEVTPVVMANDWEPSLFQLGLETGCNYIHKAGYWGANVPESIKKLDRESFYTDITVDSTPKNPDDEDYAYNQVVGSLNKNGLKYYDIFRAHFGWRSVDDYKNKRGTYRAFERLKKEGKVKYFGVSQHNYVPYPEILAAEIDEGLIDSMQVFMTYGTSKTDLEIFEKCRKAGIGMIAMKINANGRGNMGNAPDRQQELKSSGMIGRSLIRHVLTAKGSDDKPIFDCCVTNLRNVEMFEENVGAFTQSTAMADGFMPGGSRLV